MSETSIGVMAITEGYRYRVELFTRGDPGVDFDDDAMMMRVAILMHLELKTRLVVKGVIDQTKDNNSRLTHVLITPLPTPDEGPLRGFSATISGSFVLDTVKWEGIDSGRFMDFWENAIDIIEKESD